jgi:phosphoribosyl 1,2-cyclic phosphodiesterase
MDVELVCWGSRGSIPCPLTPDEVTAKVSRALDHFQSRRPATAERQGADGAEAHIARHIHEHGRAMFSTYGGDTPCLELRGLADVTVVFDMGTGFRNFSAELVRTDSARRKRLAVFLTHLHLDHVFGLPMSLVGYQSDATIDIHAQQRYEGEVGRFLAGVQEPPFFPVPLDQMGAKFVFHDFSVGPEPIWTCQAPRGPVQIRAAASPHPNDCVNYRVDGPFGAFVYATDRESPGADEAFAAFCDGADLLIHDAQYTPDEYEGRNGPCFKGRGHSTYRMAVDAALDGRVGRLALFHHDPDRSDEDIDRLWTDARAYMDEAAAARRQSPIPVEMAFDGAVWRF